MEELRKSKIVSIERLKANKASPILATFQNASLSREKSKKVVCKRVETAKDRRKFALIATESNVYKADITDESAYEDTYLAVHNKDTGEINLVQVQKASFKHVLYDNTRTAFEQNIVDSKKVLLKDFGGKKASTAYDRNQKTQINSSILEAAVDKVLDEVDADKIFKKEEEGQQQGSAEEAKPPMSIFPEIKGDVAGKSAREIFTLNTLLGDDIIEHLAEISLEALKTDPKELPFTTPYLKGVAEGLQVSKAPESPDNIKQMSTLIYAQMLVHLINHHQGKKLFEPQRALAAFSPRLHEHLVKNFFTSGSKIAPDYSNATRQKSIVFYTILVLSSSKAMEIDINDILNGIKLSKRELLKYATVIGCKTKAEKLVLKQIGKLKDTQFEVPTFKGKKERR